MDYVTYIRVSTDRQDHGLDAQKASLANFVRQEGSSIVAEYVETASGKDNDRPELAKALKDAKKRGATLLIAKLDRVSRRVSFIASLMESNIPLKVADMPNADTFQLHIYAALAQREREAISIRTKEGLKAAKAKGIELGKNGKVLAKRFKKEADTFAFSVKPLIEEAIELGIDSNRTIAAYLTEKGIKSPKGKAIGHATVFNIRKRLELV